LAEAESQEFEANLALIYSGYMKKGKQYYGAKVFSISTDI
jgi:hypothetical protein